MKPHPLGLFVHQLCYYSKCWTVPTPQDQRTKQDLWTQKWNVMVFRKIFRKNKANLLSCFQAIITAHVPQCPPRPGWNLSLARACLCHVFLKLDSIIISTQHTRIVLCTPMRVSSAWLSRCSVHLLCCGAPVDAPLCFPAAWWVQVPLHLADMLHVLFPSLAYHAVMGILTFSCKLDHLLHFSPKLSAHLPNGSTFSHAAGFIISLNRNML